MAESLFMPWPGLVIGGLPWSRRLISRDLSNDLSLQGPRSRPVISRRLAAIVT